MTLSIREFTRNIYKYMKVGEYVVTKGGKKAFVVTIKEYEGDNVVTPKVIMLNKLIDEYGCGCKKVEGQVMCKKHGRY